MILISVVHFIVYAGTSKLWLNLSILVKVRMTVVIMRLYYYFIFISVICSKSVKAADVTRK